MKNNKCGDDYVPALLGFPLLFRLFSATSRFFTLLSRASST